MTSTIHLRVATPKQGGLMVEVHGPNTMRIKDALNTSLQMTWRIRESANSEVLLDATRIADSPLTESWIGFTCL